MTIKEPTTPLPELSPTSHECLADTTESHAVIRTESVTATAGEVGCDVDIKPVESQERDDWTPTRTSPKPYLALVHSVKVDEKTRPLSPAGKALVEAERARLRGEARVHRREDIEQAIRIAVETPRSTPTVRVTRRLNHLPSSPVRRRWRWLLPALGIFVLFFLSVFFTSWFVASRASSPAPAMQLLQFRLDVPPPGDLHLDGVPFEGPIVELPLDGRQHTLDVTIDGRPFRFQVTSPNPSPSQGAP